MIVITGANGFIGGHVKDYMNEKGEVVWPLVDKTFFDVSNERHWYDPAKIPQKGVQALVHCAGKLMIDLWRPEAYMMVNTLGTIYACEYCIRTGAKLIYLQTHSDINANGDIHIYETTPRAFVPSLGNGSAAFVASKIAAVEVIEAFNRSNQLYGVILRLANVRGYGSQDTKHNTYFHQMIKKATEGSDIELWGALTTRRDLIYVKDVARAVYSAMHNASPGLFNIGTGKGLTWEEEVKAIVEVFSDPNFPSNLIYRPEKEEVRKHSCIFAINRAFRDFGWSPIYSYKAGLEDMKKIRDSKTERRI